MLDINTDFDCSKIIKVDVTNDCTNPVGVELCDVRVISVNAVDCLGTVTAQDVNLIVQTVPHPDYVQKVQICSTEFDKTILCNENGLKVIAVVSYSDTGVPTTNFYNLNGTAYTGNLTLLASCPDIDTESDTHPICVDGVSDLLQHIVKTNGQPTGVVFYTTLQGVVVPTPTGVITVGACSCKAEKIGEACYEVTETYTLNPLDMMGASGTSGSKQYGDVIASLSLAENTLAVTNTATAITPLTGTTGVPAQIRTINISFSKDVKWQMGIENIQGWAGATNVNSERAYGFSIKPDTVTLAPNYEYDVAGNNILRSITNTTPPTARSTFFYNSNSGVSFNFGFGGALGSQTVGNIIFETTYTKKVAVFKDCNDVVTYVDVITGAIVNPALVIQCSEKVEIDGTFTNWLPLCVDGVQWFVSEYSTIDNATGLANPTKVYKQGAEGVITTTAPTGIEITEGYCCVDRIQVYTNRYKQNGAGALRDYWSQASGRAITPPADNHAINNTFTLIGPDGTPLHQNVPTDTLTVAQVSSALTFVSSMPYQTLYYGYLLVPEGISTIQFRDNSSNSEVQALWVGNNNTSLSKIWEVWTGAVALGGTPVPTGSFTVSAPAECEKYVYFKFYASDIIPSTRLNLQWDLGGGFVDIPASAYSIQEPQIVTLLEERLVPCGEVYELKPCESLEKAQELEVDLITSSKLICVDNLGVKTQYTVRTDRRIDNSTGDVIDTVVTYINGSTESVIIPTGTITEGACSVGVGFAETFCDISETPDIVVPFTAFILTGNVGRNATNFSFSGGDTPITGVAAALLDTVIGETYTFSYIVSKLGVSVASVLTEAIADGGIGAVLYSRPTTVSGASGTIVNETGSFTATSTSTLFRFIDTTANTINVDLRINGTSITFISANDVAVNNKFIRYYTPDGNTATFEDYTIDGQAYTVLGTITQCEEPTPVNYFAKDCYKIDNTVDFDVATGLAPFNDNDPLQVGGFITFPSIDIGEDYQFILNNYRTMLTGSTPNGGNGFTYVVADGLTSSLTMANEEPTPLAHDHKLKITGLTDVALNVTLPGNVEVIAGDGHTWDGTTLKATASATNNTETLVLYGVSTQAQVIVNNPVGVGNGSISIEDFGYGRITTGTGYYRVNDGGIVEFVDKDGNILSGYEIVSCVEGAVEKDMTSINWNPMCVNGNQWYWADISTVDNSNGTYQTITMYKSQDNATPTTIRPFGAIQLGSCPSTTQVARRHENFVVTGTTPLNISTGAISISVTKTNSSGVVNISGDNSINFPLTVNSENFTDSVNEAVSILSAYTITGTLATTTYKVHVIR